MSVGDNVVEYHTKKKRGAGNLLQEMEIGSQKLKYSEYYASIKILVHCCGIISRF
jgi:hypothetical protein